LSESPSLIPSKSTPSPDWCAYFY